ncbi:ArsA family ATPase [Nodosilinea sp. E11]|uniref:ArsA family ATPase n=1 Tax=Nodosilinea sp. E11 TaxID=3037479 RepID=UPI0029346D8B|nr:ArsA family ATPase [Nodosilinea sp. E11]WOD38503.1 ArsA family ATPase [Nodosilinea sp. E11]
MLASATQQLIMFSGKGGVGKTTLSCGFARQLAQQHPNETVLLLSTDPAHSLGDVLLLAVDNTPTPLADLPNLQVRALDAVALLEQFRTDYGTVLELLVERGSFVAGDDLSPVWDMGWPGLDELMALLEIQRILRDREADRVVVDMAPSGHTLSLFALMDFMDTLLESLGQFQQKHRTLTETLAGRYTPDEADAFIADMRHDLEQGRGLMQDRDRTVCWVVGIPEPMSLAESDRFITALGRLGVPLGGLVINRILQDGTHGLESQHRVLAEFKAIAQGQPVLGVPVQPSEPVGTAALDALMPQVKPLNLATLGEATADDTASVHQWPTPIPPGIEDLVAAGRRLIVVGGKGGVGKTTVSAALGWGLAERHPETNLRVMSIDPAHSLGDAFGQPLGHEPTLLRPNLQAQEVSADMVLDQFRTDYLWELADMMAGDSDVADGIQMLYGPDAWRQIVAQALPGIDEMLSLITVMDLLERNEQQLIVLDTAPTGHLLRFLEMPTALGDWLGWIFKLWIKYKDVVGRVEFMGRLRTLRQRVLAAQAKLQDPQHTEFIGVVQNQSAILAEASRLNQTLSDRGIAQHYIVHNRYQAGLDLPADLFPHRCIVRLAALAPSPSPFDQVKQAAHLLLAPTTTAKT